MPRFDNENELLEKLRDSAGKMKIWTEYTQKGLENTRYEIINGMVILKPHYGRISGEIAGNLNYLYHKSSAEHYLFTNFDVKIDDDNIYLPTAIIEKKFIIYANSNETYSTKPVVVFEELAKDNKHLLNAKFEHYQKIDTLQEYVLIDLNNPQILVYRKDNHWQKEHLSFDDKLYLKSVDYTVKVADIYENIEF